MCVCIFVFFVSDWQPLTDFSHRAPLQQQCACLSKISRVNTSTHTQTWVGYNHITTRYPYINVPVSRSLSLFFYSPCAAELWFLNNGVHTHHKCCMRILLCHFNTESHYSVQYCGNDHRDSIIIKHHVRLHQYTARADDKINNIDILYVGFRYINIWKPLVYNNRDWFRDPAQCNARLLD